MSQNNSSNQDFSNNNDGFTLGGGTTERKLTVTGANITLTGSGTNVYTMPSATDTLVGRASTDTLTNKNLTSSTNTFPTFNQNTTGTASNVTGTVAVANGGTGDTTLTSGNVLVGAGTSAVTTSLAAPASNFVGLTDTQTLTNKTFDSTSPTVFFYTGMILPFGGFSAPSGWLMCNGSAQSRTTYANLFNAITITQTGSTTSGSATITGLSSTASMGPGMPLTGTGIPSNTFILTIASSTSITISANATATGTPSLLFMPYGVGDASTTFNLPNGQGNVLVGFKASDTAFGAIGQTGGEETHILTISEMPSHNHSSLLWNGVQVSLNSGSGGGYHLTWVSDTNNDSSSFNNSDTGGSSAHNNIQPYQTIGGYIIKT